MVGNSRPLALQAVNLALFTHTKFTLVFKEVALLLLFTFFFSFPRPLQATEKEKETPTYIDKDSKTPAAL